MAIEVRQQRVRVSPVLATGGGAPERRSSDLCRFRQMKAGKMKLVGTMLQPDQRKGMLRLFTSPEDQLLHLTWTSRETGVMEDDRMIFPGDAEFKYVEQARNNPKNPRVYVLKFQGSAERLFFWMQSPKADQDEDNMRKINARISGTGDDASPGGLGNLDQQQLLSMLTRAAGGAAEEQDAALGDTDMAPADASVPAIPSNTAQNLANEGGTATAGGGAGAFAGGGAFNQAALQQMLANLGRGGAGGAGNMQAMAAAQVSRVALCV